MANHYKISFIGAGNLAHHLAPELENAGHTVTEVYSRDPEHAKSLQSKLYNANISASLDFSDSESEIFVIAVSDEAIELVAQDLALPGEVIVVHTSGGQPIRKLGYTATENIGVFYPLQTFTKGKTLDFSEIPILIEAENQNTLNILGELGKSVSKQVYHVNSKDRLAIHVAAVFACNFTNFLINISEKILNRQGFDLEILRPLIAETLNKSLDIGPEEAQTGPAVRGDMEILDKHMDFLNDDTYKQIYQLLSQEILKKYE